MALRPGEHTLSATLFYRGNGNRVLSYYDQYTYTVTAAHRFSVVDGTGMRIRVLCREKGNFATTAVENRPFIEFQVEDGSAASQRRKKVPMAPLSAMSRADAEAPGHPAEAPQRRRPGLAAIATRACLVDRQRVSGARAGSPPAVSAGTAGDADRRCPAPAASAQRAGCRNAALRALGRGCGVAAVDHRSEILYLLGVSPVRRASRPSEC